MKQVIVITDGDETARRAAEKAAANVGGRCISLSGGNPTEASAEEIAAAVKNAPGNPVLIMVDDGGLRGRGPGERILASLAGQPGIRIIGAIAVASHTDRVEGVPVEISVDRSGRTIPGAVDKEGRPRRNGRITGDTVDILNDLDIPLVIGLGDLGKMDRADQVEHGARVTTAAIREILRRTEGPN